MRILSVSLGMVLAMLLFALSYLASISGHEALSHGLSWQGWWLQSLTPCVDIGTSAKSLCEGTPLTLAVFLAGISVGAVLYSAVAYVCIVMYKRRPQG